MVVWNTGASKKIFLLDCTTVVSDRSLVEHASKIIIKKETHKTNMPVLLMLLIMKMCSSFLP